MDTATYGIALNADIALHRGKVIRSVIVQDAVQKSKWKARASDDGVYTTQSADIVPISASVLDLSDE
jgi:hypothetical protein